jgi:catechol 2,3-dioxygenase-like lactoylglutathione lyase family enzyme
MDQQGIGTDVLCQVGIVVRDIERAVDAYSEVFGVPRPEIVLTDEPDVAKTTYRGERTDARAKLAFFDMGQVALELIEPVGGPSTWQAFLDEKGEGVHHLAFIVQGTDEVVAFLESKDIGVVQQGRYEGGMYTYLDAESTLGVVLELLENF